jgi:putative ABC transport system permease protein
MRWVSGLAVRLRWLFGRKRAERELAAEFAFHLDCQIDENIARGMPPVEARAAALRRVGGIAQLEEECRDVRRLTYIEDLLADIRYAIRGFRKSPGFASIAILTLALGIGAATALFSLASAVLLRALPVADSDRLAVIWEADPSHGFEENTPAPANFVDWKTQTRTFEDIAAAAWQSYNLTGNGEAERLTGLRVTANFLTVLGVKPSAGRFFLRTDDAPESPPTTVISYGLWRRRFGGDPNLIGRTISLNGQKHTVVGVAPAGFQFPSRGADLWVTPGFMPRDMAQRGSHYLFVVGRLKAEVSLTQARTDMTVIARRLELQYPQTNKNVGTAIVPLREYYAGNVRLAVNVLLGAVGAILLIACSNLAHLALARGTVRRREIALRAALGAGRARVVRQLLTESIVLASAAAALGAGLSTAAFRFLARLIPASFPEGTTLRLDLPALAFTACIAVLTAMFFGVGPALQAIRLNPNELLKQGAGRGSAGAAPGGFRGTLVVAEMTLTMILLVAAGLLLTSYERIRNVNVGFRAEHVLTLETPLPAAKYGDLRQRAEFYRQVVERAAQIPGVVSAAYVNFPPFTLKGGISSFVIEGRPAPAPGQSPEGANRVATPDYLRTMGIPLLRGRNYDERDGPETPPVIVVNQTLAQTWWPDEDPLGRRIQFGGGGPNQPFYSIIGIAGDVKQMGLDVPARAEIYFPTAQPSPGGSFFWPGTLVVRTTGDPLALAPSLRRMVGAVDSDQPVADIRTMNEIIDKELSSRQTPTIILSAFAFFALLLAFLGVFSVLSYTVTRRTAEIGVRMALGAQPGDIVGGIVWQGFKCAAISTICGLAGAFALTRVLSTLLFNVSPRDPGVLAGVILLLLAVAMLASFIPARRAVAVDPVIALRYE